MDRPVRQRPDRLLACSSAEQAIMVRQVIAHNVSDTRLSGPQATYRGITTGINARRITRWSSLAARTNRCGRIVISTMSRAGGRSIQRTTWRRSPPATTAVPWCDGRGARAATAGRAPRVRPVVSRYPAISRMLMTTVTRAVAPWIPYPADLGPLLRSTIRASPTGMNVAARMNQPSR